MNEAREPRLSMPVGEWPVADRTAWERACRPGTRLSRGGAASHMAPETRNDLAMRYGLFLGHLQRSGRLDLDLEPAGLVTPTTIASFVAELQARVRSVTVAQTVYKVRRTAELIAPGRNFDWLKDIERDLALVAVPIDKFPRTVFTERLVKAGLTLCLEAETSQGIPPITRALLSRNGLMIALLAVCPIRSKNFSTLELGCSLSRQDRTWWVILRKTKSQRPDERPLPPELDDPIRSYLTRYRPLLLRLGDNVPAPDLATAGRISAGMIQDDLCNIRGPLWISARGDALSPTQMARCIANTTRAALGVAVSPHLFRTAAATTAALARSDLPHLASALLQHGHPSVTEEHYNRASSLSVAGEFIRIVRSLSG